MCPSACLVLPVLLAAREQLVLLVLLEPLAPLELMELMVVLVLQEILALIQLVPALLQMELPLPALLTPTQTAHMQTLMLETIRIIIIITTIQIGMHTPHEHIRVLIQKDITTLTPPHTIIMVGIITTLTTTVHTEERITGMVTGGMLILN